MQTLISKKMKEFLKEKSDICFKKILYLLVDVVIAQCDIQSIQNFFTVLRRKMS